MFGHVKVEVEVEVKEDVRAVEVGAVDGDENIPPHPRVKYAFAPCVASSPFAFSIVWPAALWCIQIWKVRQRQLDKGELPNRKRRR